MGTPKTIINAITFCWVFLIKYKTRNIIMKTEQTTIAYAQWDRWTSHDKTPYDSHWCYIKIALKVKRNLPC